MKEEKTCKPKIETSKLLLVVLLSLISLLLITTTVYTFLSKDSAPLVTFIDGAMKLATIAIGFYYWKAKCENLQKYKQTKKIEMGDDYEK